MEKTETKQANTEPANQLPETVDMAESVDAEAVSYTHLQNGCAGKDRPDHRCLHTGIAKGRRLVDIRSGWKHHDSASGNRRRLREAYVWLDHAAVNSGDLYSEKEEKGWRTGVKISRQNDS